MEFLSVQDARQRILSTFSAVSSEPLALSAAAGRVLAVDIYPAVDLPIFDNSAMDGFAVRAADVRTASQQTPVELIVTGDIPAGHSPGITIGPGQTARIMTGAVMPSGADTGIPVEETDFNKRTPDSPPPPKVQVFQAADKGSYVRLSLAAMYSRVKRSCPAGLVSALNTWAFLQCLGSHRSAFTENPALS